MTAQSKHLTDYRQMERSDFVHFFELSTRWGDADALGHINNTLYARYYESSRLDYFEKLMGMHFTPALTSGVILADMKIAYLKQYIIPLSWRLVLELAAWETVVWILMRRFLLKIVKS